MLILNLIIVLLLFAGLHIMKRKEVSFGKRILFGLFAGILYGAGLQAVYGLGADVIKETVSWLNVVANGYIHLLKLIVTPLILVSIITSILQLKDIRTFRTTGLTIIGILLFTTLIAAGIGAASALGYGLSAVGMSAGDAELGAAQKIETKLQGFQAASIQEQLINIIPTNVFHALTGQGQADTLSVVFLAAVIGLSILHIRQYRPESAEFLQKIVVYGQDIVMEVVEFILRITPYSVLALIAKFIATRKHHEAHFFRGRIVHGHSRDVPRASAARGHRQIQSAGLHQESLSGTFLRIHFPHERRYAAADDARAGA